MCAPVRKARIALVVSVGLVSATVVSLACGGQADDLSRMADQIARDIGQVRQLGTKGSLGPVFVFEEFHTSRVGQLQIAVMLLRLHDRYGMRLIGLEGAIQSDRALNAGWFHSLGGASARGRREDVALRMLAEGEISAPEFMALLFSDVKVRGLEVKREYDVKLDVEGSPATAYLIGIAEKKLRASDIRKINALIQQKKADEAFEIIRNADAWVREQFEAMNKEEFSAEERVKRLRQIQAKAGQLRARVEPGAKDGLEKTIAFLEMASRRSETMVRSLTRHVRALPRRPAAMTIGAAHSKTVVEKLRSRDVAFALLRPCALNPDYANLSVEQFNRKSQRKWARISPGTLGRLLNSERKPPPFIETATGKSYASAYLAAILIAEAARSGKRIPEDIRAQLAGLPQFRIDWDSFTQDGHDVIYCMWLIKTDGREMEVWARVGTADTVEQSKSLEQKLLQRIADLGGSDKVPPRKPPSKSEGTKDKEGPGDGKRGDVVISRVGRSALVVHGKSREKVNAVGRVSG